MNDNPYLGIGLYSVPEVALYIGARAQSVRRWVADYTTPRAAGLRAASRPLVNRELSLYLENHKILTFKDLIEIQLVAFYRKAGVSMAYLRRAADLITAETGAAHPFASRRLRTEGGRLHVVTGKGQRRLVREIFSDQLAIHDILEPFFQKLDYQDDLVRHYWPLGKRKGVVFDPARNFGKPIDDQSGIPTAALYAMVSGGRSTIDEVARWYEVAPLTVRHAVEFETSLRDAKRQHEQNRLTH